MSAPSGRRALLSAALLVALAVGLPWWEFVDGGGTRVVAQYSWYSDSLVLGVGYVPGHGAVVRGFESPARVVLVPALVMLLWAAGSAAPPAARLRQLGTVVPALLLVAAAMALAYRAALPALATTVAAGLARRALVTGPSVGPGHRVEPTPGRPGSAF